MMTTIRIPDTNPAHIFPMFPHQKPCCTIRCHVTHKCSFFGCCQIGPTSSSSFFGLQSPKCLMLRDALMNGLMTILKGFKKLFER